MDGIAMVFIVLYQTEQLSGRAGDFSLPALTTSRLLTFGCLVDVSTVGMDDTSVVFVSSDSRLTVPAR